MRYITALDGSKDVSLLDSSTLETMLARPALSQWQDSDAYYGMGWLVRPQANDANW